MSALQRQIANDGITRLNATSKAQGSRKIGAKVARLEARPPRLPPVYKDHLQFYGFYINEDWVMKFAERELPGDEPPNVDSALFWFLQYLRAKARYSNINVEGAIIDADTPPDATVCEGFTGISQITIFTLCAWEKTAWDSRPTQAQVKILSEIMDMEPRWFIDVNSPDMYDE